MNIELINGLSSLRGFAEVVDFGVLLPTSSFDQVTQSKMDCPEASSC